MTKVRKVKTDPKREDRIANKIVIDCYTADEQAMGWYHYLADKLHFPFLATCIAKRAISPLHKGDEVEVVAMGPEEECFREIFVSMPWGVNEALAVPLAQLKPIHADIKTQEAIADWHYWLAQGYLL